MKTKIPKPIKVLLIGQNYASVINSLSIGFDNIEGVKARALSLDRFTSQHNNYSNYFYKTISSEQGKLAYFISKAWGLIVFLYLLWWCDIVHVYFITSDTRAKKMEKSWIDFFCKRKVVTFMGSEVRVPEISASRNLHFSEAHNQPDYEYKSETRENSYKVQKDYADEGYKLVIWDVEEYIDKELFKNIMIVPHASKNSLPPATRKTDTILVVHSPSAPVAKGTAIISLAMQKITDKYPQVSFKILTGMSNKEYQQRLSESDILIDQVIWGAYGVAAQQAMEMGKVVCAYVNDDRILLYGGHCPIVNVNKDTLYGEIEKLINDPIRLDKLKQESVIYYNDMHRPEQVAAKMKNAYSTFFYGS